MRVASLRKSLLRIVVGEKRVKRKRAKLMRRRGEYFNCQSYVVSFLRQKKHPSFKMSSVAEGENEHNLAEDKECIICLGTCSFPVKLECPCETRFCRACLMQWLQSENNRGCPLCRVRSDLVPLEPGDEDYYFSLMNKGYSCIARCKQGEFKEKELLMEAGDHGFIAIKYDGSRPEAFVMIAYLFLLVSKTAKARLFLEKALEIEPKHQDASKLLECIEKETREKHIN